MTTAKLTSKGQITLPAAMRRRLGLRPGDRVRVSLHEAGILIQPVEGRFVDSLVGLGRECWEAEGGATRYLERERGPWESRARTD
ncbi:MAG: AbrB/MazE/SpoVT family DNA-binding domain-containing protein [Myxococcales bacterium]|nr:AbrB/MazE/SpoVT family DNA-binding domain-containing protein [Planctomycetota bacterium]MCB9540758.1 AbrB/MazE/SpoVT family DNA-binding domain-containing protein [Myxococcales bacterium]